MTGRSSTRLQVSGERFAARRMQRALLCGDVRPAGEPLGARSRSLAAGCLLAGIAVAGCAALAFAQPRPAPGEAPILLGRPSGALYVRVDDTLHPVLNLASARLIAATDANPRPVLEADLGRVERGPLLGIPGAPQVLGAALSQTESSWSVCDTDGDTGITTTVVVGAGRPGSGFHDVDPDRAVLVTAEAGAGPESGVENHLLHRGRRAMPSPAGSAPAETRRPAGPAPRRVSGLLLGAIPEAPPATLPGRIDELPAGAPTLCATWSGPSGDTGVTLSVGVGLPLPAGRTPVALARADGNGPALDAFYLPPGRSAYVRVSGPAGGARYLIADTGVRFVLGDADAARSLGLPAAPLPLPWPMLAGLPVGPQLSRSQALLARDVVGAPAGPP